MNRQDFDYQQLRLSMTAGMNQRFHQARARHWLWWNRFIQISVGSLAVLGLCLAVAAAFSESRAIDWIAVFVAFLAAVAAIALNVVPVGDWAQQHLDLFRRWCDLREEVDSLLFEVTGDPTDGRVERLKQLDGKVHRNCSAEPGLDEKTEKILMECHAAEKRSRRKADPECAPSQAAQAAAI